MRISNGKSMDTVLWKEENSKNQRMSKDGNQEQTLYTYDVGSSIQTRSHWGEEGRGGGQVLSPLHHPCSPENNSAVTSDLQTQDLSMH